MTYADCTVTALCCRRCGRVLAYSDGVTLHVGGASFTRRIALPCGQCGAERQWWPKALDNTA